MYHHIGKPLEIKNEIINLLTRLSRLTKQKNPKTNDVIVFDIDGTLIDENGKAIDEIITAYFYVKNFGYQTAIITARPDITENIIYTLEQLRSHGITGYKFAYFLPLHKTDQATYKLLARKNITDKGYNIVASVGDMPWDIGEYGGVGFIVTN